MKKRIISIILAATVIFSVFSCNAFAVDGKNIASILGEGPEEAKITVSYDGDEWNADYRATFYQKGDKFAVDIGVPINDFGMNLKIRLIIKDNKAYMVFLQMPFIYLSFGDVDSVVDLENKNFEMETVSREEEVIDGKTVVTEIMKDEEGNKSKVITEDGKPKEISNYDKYGNYMGKILIEDISYEVSDWVFWVPFFGIDMNSIDFDIMF